jgi:hypothetical protein
MNRALAKKPADRYQTAVAARTALEESLSAPVPGSAQWHDTYPSIGPFPATTGQFAGMQTPIPPSLVGETERKKPDTAMQRIMTGETMLAGAGTAPATSQPGLTSSATPNKKRWPLLVAAGTVIVGSAIAIAMTMRTTEKPAEEPPAKPPIAPIDPVRPKEPIVAPPDTGSGSAAVTEVGSAAPPAEVKKPPRGNRPPKGTRPPRPTPPPAEAKGAGSPPPEAKTVPPPPTNSGSGSGTKPPVLPF